MQIIKELDGAERQAIEQKHKEHPLFGTHICNVLNSVHCFQVNIVAADYSRILVYSCPTWIPGQYEHYKPLSKAVDVIKANPDFLERRDAAQLNGVRVRYYMEQFNAGKFEIGDIFVIDGIDVFGVTDVPNITDGMHRLVAYGLSTNMRNEYFPISVYYGTEKQRYTAETQWNLLN
jgi:hypothetical protein